MLLLFNIDHNFAYHLMNGCMKAKLQSIKATGNTAIGGSECGSIYSRQDNIIKANAHIILSSRKCEPITFDF